MGGQSLAAWIPAPSPAPGAGGGLQAGAPPPPAAERPLRQHPRGLRLRDVLASTPPAAGGERGDTVKVSGGLPRPPHPPRRVGKLRHRAALCRRRLHPFPRPGPGLPARKYSVSPSEERQAEPGRGGGGRGGLGQHRSCPAGEGARGAGQPGCNPPPTRARPRRDPGPGQALQRGRPACSTHPPPLPSPPHAPPLQPACTPQSVHPPDPCPPVPSGGFVETSCQAAAAIRVPARLRGPGPGSCSRLRRAFVPPRSAPQRRTRPLPPAQPRPRARPRPRPCSRCRSRSRPLLLSNGGCGLLSCG